MISGYAMQSNPDSGDLNNEDGPLWVVNYTLAEVSDLGGGFFKAKSGTGKAYNHTTGPNGEYYDLTGKQDGSGYAFIFATTITD